MDKDLISQIMLVLLAWGLGGILLLNADGRSEVKEDKYLA